MLGVREDAGTGDGQFIYPSGITGGNQGSICLEVRVSPDVLPRRNDSGSKDVGWTHESGKRSDLRLFCDFAHRAWVHREIDICRAAC